MLIGTRLRGPKYRDENDPVVPACQEFTVWVGRGGWTKAQKRRHVKKETASVVAKTKWVAVREDCGGSERPHWGDIAVTKMTRGSHSAQVLEQGVRQKAPLVQRLTGKSGFDQQSLEKGPVWLEGALEEGGGQWWHGQVLGPRGLCQLSFPL